MIEKDLSLDEFTPAPGVITSLSQLTREQFLELMSSSHPTAKNFRKYHKREFHYRNLSYQVLNEFFKG
jgi:hypothetical protein